MKKHTILKSIIISLALPVIGIAEDKTPARPADPAQPPNADNAGKDPAAARNQFSGPITAVYPEEKTITINDAKLGAHKLHIGATTKLKRGDKDATWDDLKVGVKVEGVCLGGKDKAHAETLTIREQQN